MMLFFWITVMIIILTREANFTLPLYTLQTVYNSLAHIQIEVQIHVQVGLVALDSKKSTQ